MIGRWPKPGAGALLHSLRYAGANGCQALTYPLAFSRVGASAAIEQTGGLKPTTYALWLISLSLGPATGPFKTQLAAIERAFDNLFLHSA
jgi:hypothetical protein